MASNFQQPALTIREQIDNLKAIGLEFGDEQFAAEFLNNVSYFRLIKAYSLGLKPHNGRYYQGVTFEYIVDLYRFNSSFRQLLFTQIEKIEVNLRCRIANYFSTHYGVLGYKSPTNFYSEEYHARFLEDIQNEINRNRRAPFIRNFQQNYIDGEIPFYALTEICSFGTLSKFYKNMKSTDKKAIAEIYSISYTYLESWIESIAYVRNLCAHYGRIYNAKLTKTPRLYRQDRENGVSSIRIFGVLCCMKYLLPRDQHWSTFLNDLNELFKKHSNARIDTMGFPDNWKVLLSQ